MGDRSGKDPKTCDCDFISFRNFEGQCSITSENFSYVYSDLADILLGPTFWC